MVCGAAALMAIAMVAQTVRLQLLAARRTALTQKLFDVDGPSSRDPPRDAWDHAGKVRRRGKEREEVWREGEIERKRGWRNKGRERARERGEKRYGGRRNAITRAAAAMCARACAVPLCDGVHDARALQGTAAWMESQKPVQVLSQKKHARGRRDRIFDSMLRHAPREVSEVLEIPMAKVQVLERQVAKKMAREFKTERKAQQMHAVHRGMLKGFGSMMLAAKVNVTDMSVCEGKYKGCDALAENILAVAASISENCAALYFNEKQYYKCEV